MLGVALLCGVSVLTSYAVCHNAIRTEWSVWQRELPAWAVAVWCGHAVLCIAAYGTIVVYAYVHRNVAVAVVLALFTASACTWAPCLARGSFVRASTACTGVLSTGFLIVYFYAPIGVAYWVAPAVLVMQHVGFDLGWWVVDYGDRGVAPRGEFIIVVREEMLLCS